MRPAVYADECVDRPVVEALRARGFDVLTAVEAGRGEDTDELQLAHASELGRGLLSYNRVHFRRVHAEYRSKQREHGGIFLLPQESPLDRRQLRAALMLDWAGTTAELRSNLYQWNDLQQQLVGGLRIPGYSEQEVRRAVGWS